MFNIVIVKLNSHGVHPVIQSHIQVHHYDFTVEGPPSCDLYSFQVIAVNDAGTSEPSEIITRSLPSLPDMSPPGGLTPPFSS